MFLYKSTIPPISLFSAASSSSFSSHSPAVNPPHSPFETLSQATPCPLIPRLHCQPAINSHLSFSSSRWQLTPTWLSASPVNLPFQQHNSTNLQIWIKYKINISSLSPNKYWVCCPFLLFMDTDWKVKLRGGKPWSSSEVHRPKKMEDKLATLMDLFQSNPQLPW